MIELVYETHSTTTDNEDGIATGWLPGRLSPKGWDEARELGRRRANDRIEAVYASDLRRAIDTAEIAFGGSSIPVLLDWRLREIDYGDLNGTPTDKIDRAAHLDTPFPNGESYADVVARTQSFLGDLRDGARVCVVAHSANRWALDHLVHGLPLAELVAAPFDWRPGWDYAIER